MLLVFNNTDYADPAEAFWAGAAEIAKQTTLSGDVLTVERAQEGTTAISMTDTSKTWRVLAVPTRFLLATIPDHENVKAHGAVGDGTTNDTAEVQNAIDAVEAAGGGVVYFPPGTYLIDGLDITSATRLVMRGEGARILLTGTGGASPAFLGIEIATAATDVTIRDLEIEGDGNAANRHAGVWVNQGATVDRLRIIDCYIHDCLVGVALQTTAGGSGSLKDCEVRGCSIRDCSDATEGRGIFVQAQRDGSFCNISIVDNFIENSGDHSIYWSRGRGGIIDRNRIYAHRSGKSAAESPAIKVERADDVIIGTNFFSSCQDGAIDITQDATDRGSIEEKRFVVIGNLISDQEEATPAIRIGNEDPATEGFPEHLILLGNLAHQTGEDNPLLRVDCGKRLLMSGNLFARLLAAATNGQIVELVADSESSLSTTYSDLWSFVANLLHGTKSSLQLHGFGIGSAYGDSDAKTEFAANLLAVPDDPVYAAASVGNTKIAAVGEMRLSDPDWTLRQIYTGRILLDTRQITYDESGPVIISGSGAPSVSVPNGSIYYRTDGTGPNLYVRENAAWVSK